MKIFQEILLHVSYSLNLFNKKKRGRLRIRKFTDFSRSHFYITMFARENRIIENVLESMIE